MNREELERLVRAVATEILRSPTRAAPGAETGAPSCPCGGRCGGSPRAEESPAGSFRFDGGLLTDEGIRSLSLNGCRTLLLEPGTIVTPLARDRLREMGVSIATAARTSTASPLGAPANGSRSLALFVGRPGLTAENIVRSAAEESGWIPASHEAAGIRRAEPLDRAVACLRRVASGECDRAVVVGENIHQILRRAKRLAGVRPVVCWDPRAALQSRREEDANALLLSERLGLTVLGRVVAAWLSE